MTMTSTTRMIFLTCWIFTVFYHHVNSFSTFSIHTFNSLPLSSHNNERLKTYLSSTTSFVETLSRTFTKKKNPSNSETIIKGDSEYPWVFTGRLWFRPSIIKIPSSFNGIQSNHSIQPLNIFGYTVGGSVALEYDTSPIGPYKEYVAMGSLVFKSESGNLFKTYFGQWGENLYVSTTEAATICDDIWGVPAQQANITFVEESDDNMYIESAPSSSLTAISENANSVKNSFDFVSIFSKDENNQQNSNNIQVNGWRKTRKCNDNNLTLDNIKNRPSINMYWTPTIKALWLPFNLPFFQPYKENNGEIDDESLLPLHKLRLSADSIGIVKSNQIVKDGEKNTDSLGFTFPFGLVVDNVAIEISPVLGKV